MPSARCLLPRGQAHPAANLLRKQAKSLTLRIGAVVLSSQFAAGSPAAKRLMKQEKSAMLRAGGVVEPSQLAYASPNSHVSPTNWAPLKPPKTTARRRE